MESESDLALDFASFLLRYHKDLEYADFTEDNNVQDLIRRAEAFRQWADIEDLAASIDQITAVFEQHRTTAANAMSEIFQHTERIKKEVHSKISETGNLVTQLKGEQENLRNETFTNLNSVQQATQQAALQAAAMQVKQPDMSSADIKELKKMIVDMRETLLQTDNFVKGNLLTKIELLSTGLEDANTVNKNLENKYNSYKGTFDSLDANIREQLDII